MPTPDSTPFACWPRHLQASWPDCAERGEIDGQNPPDSMIDAYLLVAELLTKRLSGIPWGDGRQDLADDEVGLLDAALEPKLAACPQCGAGELEHFYTSKRNGKTLCTDCFQHRVERGLVREAAARNS